MKRRWWIGSLAVLLVFGLVFLGALCESGDDDDDDNDAAPEFTKNCDKSLKAFYNDCGFNVDALAGPEAVDLCENGGPYWQCFVGCYANSENDCATFAECVKQCDGDPHQGSEDDTWDDDSASDDDTSSGNEEWCAGYTGANDCCKNNDPCDWAVDGYCDCDGKCSWDHADCGGGEDDDDDGDDDAASGICAEGLTNLYECGFALIDDDGYEIPLNDVIAWCEEGDAVALCVAACGVEEGDDCDALEECATNCF